MICKAIQGFVDAGKSAKSLSRQQAQDLHDKLII